MSFVVCGSSDHSERTRWLIQIIKQANNPAGLFSEPSSSKTVDLSITLIRRLFSSRVAFEMQFDVYYSGALCRILFHNFSNRSMYNSLDIRDYCACAIFLGELKRNSLQSFVSAENLLSPSRQWSQMILPGLKVYLVRNEENLKVYKQTLHCLPAFHFAGLFQKT